MKAKKRSVKINSLHFLSVFQSLRRWERVALQDCSYCTGMRPLLQWVVLVPAPLLWFWQCCCLPWSFPVAPMTPYSYMASWYSCEAVWLSQILLFFPHHFRDMRRLPNLCCGFLLSSLLSLWWPYEVKKKYFWNSKSEEKFSCFVCSCKSWRGERKRTKTKISQNN